MNRWQRVWREGVAPALSTNGLLVLKAALLADDPGLLQGATSCPPPMQCVLDWPCEGACAIGYAAWKGDGAETVGEVEERFAKACYKADCELREPAAVRYFLNWFDETPRDQMRRELLAEIELSLKERL
jgi:hypothetical protein